MKGNQIFTSRVRSPALKGHIPIPHRMEHRCRDLNHAQLRIPQNFPHLLTNQCYRYITRNLQPKLHELWVEPPMREDARSPQEVRDFLKDRRLAKLSCGIRERTQLKFKAFKQVQEFRLERGF